MAAQQGDYTGYGTVGEMGVALPIELGFDEYFVLGDNSRHSFDSRFNGPVLRQDILGKVIRIFYPFDRIREIE